MRAGMRASGRFVFVVTRRRKANTLQERGSRAETLTFWATRPEAEREKAYLIKNFPSWEYEVHKQAILTDGGH